MESHKRILGILFVISGILRVFGALFFMGIFSAFFPMILQEVSPDEMKILEWIGQFFQLITWMFIIFFSIPRIIAGIALLNKKPWGLTMALIWGCLGVFSFPIGTALCIYTIWVYVEDGKAKRATA
jgi:hypothetical protein